MSRSVERPKKMLPLSSIHASASDIYRRYRLDDLVRLRTMARRYYIDSLSSKAQALVEDSSSCSSLHPYHVPLFTPPTWMPLYRRHFLSDRARNYFVSPRRGLPDLPSRIPYDKRLADMYAEQLEASRPADALLLSNFLSGHRAILPRSPDDLELIAYDEAAAAANENDDVSEIDDTDNEVRKRQISDREAQRERVKILNQIRSYRRRFASSRVLTRSMNRSLYDL